MGRFVTVFALGILCALAAMVAVIGYWVIASVVLGVAAAVALAWLLVRDAGNEGGGAAPPAGADPEHAKAVQYAMRNKSQHPGGGL
jgi:hypothetical protein